MDDDEHITKLLRKLINLGHMQAVYISIAQGFKTAGFSEKRIADTMEVPIESVRKWLEGEPEDYPLKR